jgi:hypothetical protein
MALFRRVETLRYGKIRTAFCWFVVIELIITVEIKGVFNCLFP